MSNKEYNRKKNEFRPFFTLLVVIASSLLLASCGGGNESMDSQATVANEDGRMKALGVPVTWTGRVPPKIKDSPDAAFVASEDGAIAKRVLIASIIDGKDSVAKTLIARQGWRIEGQTFDLVKITINQDGHISLRAAMSLLTDSGLFNSVTFERRAGDKDFTRRDPSLDSGNYWNYSSINARQAWQALGSVATAAKANTVAVFDSNFSIIKLQDLTLDKIEGGRTDCGDTNPENSTCSSHGYHVSGIIGATGNDEEGHVGIASGYTNLSKISAFQGRSVSTHAANIRTALMTGVEAIPRAMNFSLGNTITSNSQTLSDQRFSELTNSSIAGAQQVEDALSAVLTARQKLKLQTELVFIQASGNEGRVLEPNGTTLRMDYSDLFASYLVFRQASPIYEYVKDRTLFVGSHGSSREVSDFTSEPRKAIHSDRFILAPGENIYSNTRKGIVEKSGTSMAAPHVTAVAAAIFQANPDLTGKDVTQIILGTSSNKAGTDWKEGDGYKYLNAERAVKKAIRLKNEANCGTISAPVTIPIPVNALAVNQPYSLTVATVIAPKNGRRFASYLWTSSQGFIQTAFVSPDVTIAFPNMTAPPAVATVSVVPVLDDGTVCTGSAVTSQFSVIAPFGISLPSTGIDAGGRMLAQGQIDPNWKVVSGPNITTPESAVASFVAAPYYRGAPASWIWVNSNGGGGINQPYAFEREFDIGNADPNSIVLTGKWAADNFGAVYINGAPAIGAGRIVLPPGDTNNLPTANAFTITTGFKPGVNTISFRVTDTGNPGGLLAWDLVIMHKQTQAPGGGLVGRYLFDDCTASDSSGLGRSAVRTGTTCVSGHRGNALQFSNPSNNVFGGNDWVTLPPHIGNSVTFSAWINWSGSTNGMVTETSAIWSLGTHTTDSFMSIWVTEGLGTIWTDKYTPNPHRVTPGTWTMFTITSDGTTESLYMNGVLLSTYQNKAIGGFAGKTSYLSRHFWAGGSNAARFRGLMDDVFVYDRVLTADEVFGLYVNTK